MTRVEIVHGFLEAFCQADLESLAHLLAPGFRFRGPFLAADSRDAYLAALRKGEMEPAAFRIHHTSETGDRVAVFYDYLKPGATVTVAQLFTVRDGRIVETLVVFDGRRAG